jgi:protein O-GlcNAc transferase
MTAIDYRLTDPYAEPPGLGDAFSVEALWRLPRVCGCYQAPDRDLPLVDHPPADRNGHVTFGCFNRFTKMSDATLGAWGQILRRVPDARLLLEIADSDEPEIRAGIDARLERAGLPLDRTDIAVRSPAGRYVLYNRIDIALDPFPYNGGTTSLDTLYMGVPFIALAGEHYVARMGHQILVNAGLAELSTESVDEYVARACQLATDRDWLRAVRHNLRGRMVSSPHMDHPQLAADIVGAFRDMWRRWAQTDPADAPS